MKHLKTTDDIIADKIRKFWNSGHAYEDVAVFFWQKYDFETEWEFVKTTAYTPDFDGDIVIFNTDFCEGQTDVKDVTIVPLYDVLTYYSKEL